MRWHQVLFLVLAGIIVVAALGLTRAPVRQSAEQGYTQLWMLPAEGAGSGVIRLGIGSMEADAASYSLELRSGDRVIRAWPEIALSPTGSWETSVALPDGSGAGGTIEALLYRSDAPGSVYRRVELRGP